MGRCALSNCGDTLAYGPDVFPFSVCEAILAVETELVWASPTEVGLWASSTGVELWALPTGVVLWALKAPSQALLLYPLFLMLHVRLGLKIIFQPLSQCLQRSKYCLNQVSIESSDKQVELNTVQSLTPSLDDDASYIMKNDLSFSKYEKQRLDSC